MSWGSRWRASRGRRSRSRRWCASTRSAAPRRFTYEAMEAQADRLDPTTEFFLHRFVVDHLDVEGFDESHSTLYAGGDPPLLMTHMPLRRVPECWVMERPP